MRRTHRAIVFVFVFYPDGSETHSSLDLLRKAGNVPCRCAGRQQADAVGQDLGNEVAGTFECYTGSKSTHKSAFAREEKAGAYFDQITGFGVAAEGSELFGGDFAYHIARKDREQVGRCAAESADAFTFHTVDFIASAHRDEVFENECERSLSGCASGSTATRVHAVPRAGFQYTCFCASGAFAFSCFFCVGFALVTARSFESANTADTDRCGAATNAGFPFTLRSARFAAFGSGGFFTSDGSHVFYRF